MTDLYAVVGHPVGHSKSPKIHAQFAVATAQDMEYTAIQAPLDGFVPTVTAFFDRGGKGLNVTVPFKQEAWKLCQIRTAGAETAGAVNTLWRDAEGRLCGDNTDGCGLIRDITCNHQVVLVGKRVLVLGAGGAVRGILQPLLAELPGEVVIANRTPGKAETLVDLFPGVTNLRAVAFDQLAGAFDVVINGTSASLAGDLPPLPREIITSQTVTYDMMYGSDVTVFNAWAQSCGANRCLDGLGMLVEQAAEAFARWRGVRPETQDVLAFLRALG